MGALRDFVADVLEIEGAAVEPVDPDGLDILAPEPLRSAMGWPELTRLGFGAVLPTGATPVGFEGEWLDRFGALLRDRGRWAERYLPLLAPVPPPGEPERLLDRAFDLPNATWRYRGAASAWARCLLLLFRYTAVADDKREGLLWLGFNQSTGAVLEDLLPRLLHLLLAEQSEWREPDPGIRHAAGNRWDAAALQSRISPLLESKVRRELEPFLRGMRRRLDRDRGRIHEYHQDLRLDALKRHTALAGAANDKAEAERRRETLRMAAIEREYAAKIEDLRHNYALRVTVDWVQTLEVFLPVHRYEVLIRRRKGERLVPLDWHATVRSPELPVCEHGLGLDHVRLVCDERLHLTDAAGQAPCASCGKTWCRACEPAKCPRCGETESRAEPVTLPQQGA
ncbi:MAG TPA: hypothetical protein VH678_02780 [Xanthobacteraceae bacterium]|jgi:hypothetical protein